jgi:hypothetical protein
MSISWTNRAGRRSDRRPGGQRFQTPDSPAYATRPGRVDRNVADFSGHIMRAMVEVPIENKPGGNSRADAQISQTANRLTILDPMESSPGRGAHIVFQAHRHAQSRTQSRCQRIGFGQIQIDRQANIAVDRIDLPGTPTPAATR